MANLNDLDDVTIDNPKVGDVVKYTAQGWQNGADATNSGPGGNPCGELDGVLYEDSAATITQPWVWKDAGCPSITVEETTGTFAGDKAEICSNAFIVRDANGKEGRLKARGTDGQIELRVNGGELYFRDDVVSPPVRLAELVASTATTSYAPIIRQLKIDTTASDDTNTERFDITEDTLTVGFGSGWATKFPTGRAYGVMVGVDEVVTMPPGANGAIVFYQNLVEMAVPGNSGLQATGSQRALHCSHRLAVSNAIFPIQPNTNSVKTGYGILQKAIITIPGNSPEEILAYRQTKAFNKFDVIKFSNNAVVTFTARVDIAKGGRGLFSTSAGRLVIFPFYSDATQPFAAPDLDSFYYATEDDLDAIYDELSPKETEASEALTYGREYRDLIRRILASLEARKANPPAGGATTAEFEQQITAGWAIADNSTLQTLDEFEAALEVYYTEISKEKYGIAILFEFEKAAGSNLRGLL